MVLDNIMEETALNRADWRKRIHVTDPREWYEGFVVDVNNLKKMNFVCFPNH